YRLIVVTQFLALILTCQLLVEPVRHIQIRTVDRNIEDENVTCGGMPIAASAESDDAAMIVEVSGIHRIQEPVAARRRACDKKPACPAAAANARRNLSGVKAARVEFQTTGEFSSDPGDRLDRHNSAGLSTELRGYVSHQHIHRSNHLCVEAARHC